MFQTMCLDIITDFLWEGKKAKGAYNVMIQHIGHGGLKLMDFESKVKALKVAWIKRLCSDNEARWKAAAKHFYKITDFNFYLKCTQGALKFQPLFYQTIQNMWSELTEVKTLITQLYVTRYCGTIDITVDKKTHNVA